MSSGWKAALASGTTALAALGAACATTSRDDERSRTPSSAAAAVEWREPGGTALVQEFEEPKAVVENAAVGEITPPPRPDLAVVDGVLQRNQTDLLAIDGVTAVWTGLNADGADSVFVAVTDAADRARVPQEVEGYPVEVVVVPGGFVPQAPDG